MNRVENAMSKPVVTIDSSHTVLDAAKLMSEKGIGCLVATEGGKPVGIVTERDLVRKVLANRLDPQKIKVSEVMSSSLITIGSGASLSDASKLMARNRIRRLVVVEGGRLLGLISTTDLARAWIKSEEPSDPLLYAIARYHAEGY